MRCARTRKTNDDDRSFDLDLVDLRISAQQVSQQQPRRQQADDSVAQNKPIQVRVAGVGVDRRRVRVEPRAEIARSEVVQAGAPDRFLDEHVGGEVDRLLVELIEHLPLQWAKRRRSEVLDDELRIVHPAALPQVRLAMTNIRRILPNI